MRHPAAPTIIAILLGFLALLLLWARRRGDGPHAGNPHPRDLLNKTRPVEGEGSGDGGPAGTAAGEKEEEGVDR